MCIYRKVLYFISLAIAMSALVGVYIVGLNPCPEYKCLGFPGKKNWKVQEIYEQRKSSWKGLLKTPDYLVRLGKIANITNQQADEFTSIRTMQMEGLFDRARSPYPGAISDEIVCDSMYRPVLNSLTTLSGISMTYFSGYLNDRYQYGSCVDSQISYKAYSGIFYCHNIRQWYQVELIVPIRKALPDEQYVALFKEIQCFNTQFSPGE